MKRLLLLLLLVAGIASAVDVGAGIYVLNIGKFDVASGSYVVDFYLSMKCDEPCSPDFEFMNGRATSFEKIQDAPAEKFYRIQAALSTNIDLKRYPFDSHSLPIEIEDKRKPIGELRYVPDNASSGIDPMVTFVGWELEGWGAESEVHRYVPYDEEYSRFVFGINIKRITLSAILKSLVPIFFIVLVGLLALLIREDKITQRISVNITTLLAAVMFHLTVTSSIPPVGYITFADKVMISTYVVLVLSVFSTVLLMRHTEAKEHEKAQRIYRVSLFGIPALASALYALVFLL